MSESRINISKTIIPGRVVYIDSAWVRFHQSLHLRRRHIDNHRFLLIESGRGEFHFPGTALDVCGGMLLLLAPGERETLYRDDHAVSYLYVEFDTDGGGDLALIDTPYLECPAASAHFRTLCSLIGSVHRERGRGVAHLLPAAIELALAPFGESEPGRNIDPRIRNVLQHIDQHLDRPLRVPELAAQAGVSMSHFRRLFQQSMHTGPKDYLIRERMNYARKILQTEGLRIGEVADLLNFENVFQFSNQYKKVHGHSPLQDRERPA